MVTITMMTMVTGETMMADLDWCGVSHRKCDCGHLVKTMTPVMTPVMTLMMTAIVLNLKRIGVVVDCGRVRRSSSRFVGMHSSAEAVSVGDIFDAPVDAMSVGVRVTPLLNVVLVGHLVTRLLIPVAVYDFVSEFVRLGKVRYLLLVVNDGGDGHLVNRPVTMSVSTVPLVFRISHLAMVAPVLPSTS